MDAVAEADSSSSSSFPLTLVKVRGIGCWKHGWIWATTISNPQQRMVLSVEYINLLTLNSFVVHSNHNFDYPFGHWSLVDRATNINILLGCRFPHKHPYTKSGIWSLFCRSEWLWKTIMLHLSNATRETAVAVATRWQKGCFALQDWEMSQKISPWEDRMHNISNQKHPQNYGTRSWYLVGRFHTGGCNH